MHSYVTFNFNLGKTFLSAYEQIRKILNKSKLWAFDVIIFKDFHFSYIYALLDVSSCF